MNQIKAGAALNYIIIGLNILTGLLYTPFMLRCLGQNEYGLYSLVASVISYLTLLDFGFGSAIVRYTAKIRATRPKNEEWSLYGMFLSAYSVLGIIVTIGGIILYFNTDRMFDRTMSIEELSQARKMMALMVLNLALTFPFSVFGSIITAYEHFVFQRVLTISRIVLSTIVLIGVLLLGYKAVALVIVQTIFSLATLLINYLYSKFRLKIKIRFSDFNKSLFKEIIVFSWWNFLGAIVDRIYWGTGQFVLGIYCGTEAVAVFSLAITVMTLYMSMSTSFNSVLLPRITVLATQKNTDTEISNLFIRTGRLQFCVLALILSGFLVFGKPFFILWAGSDYIDSYYISAIFYIALLCPLIQNVGITILQARGQQKFRSLCYLGISIVSLCAQILVTKYYGAIGCATVIGITLFAGQWVVMNVYYKCRQRLNIIRFWQEISRMSIIPLIMTIGGYYLFRHIAITTWSSLISFIACYIIIYVPLFYLYSMDNYEKGVMTSAIRKLKYRFFSNNR